MTEIDVSKLSLQGVKLLKLHCEELIQSAQADLVEYDLYVRCQTELVRRGVFDRHALLGRRQAAYASLEG